MSSTTDTSSLKQPSTNTSSTTVAAPSTKQKSSRSWLEKLHLRSPKAEEPGKESWRDASLSEEQRWKSWQKAKDREQHAEGVTGTFTQPYKAKGVGKYGYWLDADA